MPSVLSLNDVAQSPERFSTKIRIDDEALTVRPLLASDVDELAIFLQGLSEETRRLSTFSRYDKAMAQELCDAINHYDKLRFVIETSSQKIVGLLEFSMDIPSGDIERFRGYGIAVSSNTDCRFGPTLTDAFQDRGIASQVLPYMIQIARAFGKKRMILFGGVLADNPRAIRFYEKNGFVQVGEFQNNDGHQCLDMIRDLSQ